ncbi:isochorismatase family cysteine hydrolase [Fodinicurvata sp. EGI_FJ10296]|uniref:cysteine hydrolase family protein n=1 Tax=Fodinicurvata sp. EGI_FJ10296 TaxID=3231908 RepID=UPI0034556BCB
MRSARPPSNSDAWPGPRILPDLAARIEPAHTAVLVIDMQNDFLAPGFGAEKAGRDLAPGRAIVPGLQRLIAGARRAGATVAHVGFLTLPDNASDSGPWLAQRRRSTWSSDTLCLQGSPGADFLAELTPAPGDLVISKFRYSAFAATPMDVLLRARGIRTVIITGVSTNACVESTLRYAMELSYYIVVPTDGVASWSQPLHDATLENVNHRFGLTPVINEILEIWKSSERTTRGDAQ